jgi:NADPH-dependent glutamate synthase beta subunit-like oxidoreductase
MIPWLFERSNVSWQIGTDTADQPERILPRLRGCAVDPRKPKIAVVGGGPAGLTAARDLALMGYPVTLLEGSGQLGGVLSQAIPEFRLPRQRLHQDVADIVAAGFEVRLNAQWGRDFQLEDLRREGFHAVFLATGCPEPLRSRTDPEGRPLPGLDLGGITTGLSFLGEVKAGRLTELSGKVVVIGGGNVAIDAARTALRLGAREVELVCLESRQEMPAYSWEVGAAVEEGVRLSCGWGPAAFWGRNGVVEAAEFRRCVRVWDDCGRFAPSFTEERYRTSADYVIVAIGQRFQKRPFLTDAVFAKENGLLRVDPLTLQTQIPWVFAGGDLVTGPRSVVEAVAQGHEAAESIDRFAGDSIFGKGGVTVSLPRQGCQIDRFLGKAELRLVYGNLADRGTSTNPSRPYRLRQLGRKRLAALPAVIVANAWPAWRPVGPEQ